MMIKIFKIFHGKQAGFTLIEMVVVLAISSFIMTGIVLSLYQIMVLGKDVREDMRSTQFVQNTGSWISRDLLMSQEIQSGDNPLTAQNETITLYWTSASYKDASNNDWIDYYEVSYYLDGLELRRKEHVTTKVYSPNGSLIETAENQGIALISDNITDFSVNSENITLILSITALVGDSQTVQTYEIFPRALDRI